MGAGVGFAFPFTFNLFGFLLFYIIIIIIIIIILRVYKYFLVSMVELGLYFYSTFYIFSRERNFSRPFILLSCILYPVDS